MEAVSDYFQKAFAGVLNYLLCGVFALKILRHMSERMRVCAAKSLILANIPQSLVVLKLRNSFPQLTRGHFTGRPLYTKLNILPARPLLLRGYQTWAFPVPQS